MRLKNHDNEKPQTKRKGYVMRSLLVTMVAALLTIAIALPVQAGEVLLPCSDCDRAVNTSTALVLPQGETDEIQPFEDHTWGGDPDDTVYRSGWLDIYMCVGGYWDESCTHLLYHTVWLD